MTKAFVFGKFLPFHKGHEAMIRFALTQTDFLTVLICCSDRETLPAGWREKWIRDTFAGETRLEIKIFSYKESELPNTSVASRDVSQTWSEAFQKLLPDHSLLITSEPYGEYVAAFMQIRHIAFDRDKKLVPVSATDIRNDLAKHWNFLPDSVKRSFITKVVILGTESTGKTVLTEKLASYFRGRKVLEAARDLIPDSNLFTMEDLHRVAAKHARRIREEEVGNSPLLVIDTDVHITKSYADFVFQKTLDVSDEIYQANKADLHIYLDANAPFVQDGTRLRVEMRNRLDHSHRAILKAHGIVPVEIRGSWQQLFEQAVALVEAVLEGKRQLDR